MFLQRFAVTIWRASTDAFSYVADFSRRTTGSALGYLYALSVTLAFFGLLPFAIGLAVVAPQSHTLLGEQLDIVNRWYPDNLVVTISGGVLTTNQSTPVVLDLPPEWETNDHPKWSHFLVIDTEGAIDDFEQADALILFTDTAAAVRDDNGSLRVFTFSELDDDTSIMVDGTLVEGITHAIRTFSPSLPLVISLLAIAFILVLPWIIAFFTWLGSLFFLLWATVITWIISAIAGRGHRYGELYRLGLFGITNSMLLSFALTMTGLPLGWAPYALFFGWMGYVIVRFPRRASASVAPIPPAAAKKPAPAKKPRAKAPKA